MSSLLKRSLPALPRSPSSAAAARCLASVTTIEETGSIAARANILSTPSQNTQMGNPSQSSIQIPTQSLQQLLPGLQFSNAEFQNAIDVLQSKGLGHRSMMWDQRVVWGDHDQFGHVNHVRYVQWFESARALYMSKIFGPDSIKAGGSNLSMILSNLNIRYRRPIQGNDTVLIAQGAVFPLERPDRFTLRATAYSLKQRDIVSVSDQLCVVYDYEKGKSTAVPSSNLSLMQEYAIRS